MVNKKPLISKCLAVGIILLFIGIAVTPSINHGVVKASQDNDLVGVTTQACGIKGYGDTTVKLTREQYQNLEQYLVEFRTRLNQTSTREEAVPLFKEAVVELGRYRLLPKGMSVEQAQKLVIGFYHNTKLVKYLQKLSKNPEKSLLYNGNRFCLINGKAQSQTFFQGFVTKMIFYGLGLLVILGMIFDDLPLFYFLSSLSAILMILHCNTVLELSNILRDFPYIDGFIYYGVKRWETPTEYNYYPALGSIWTNGLYGVKNWSGPFYGKLSFGGMLTIFEDYYPGVNGFSGLRLYFNHTDFYFGFALNVNVGPSHP